MIDAVSSGRALKALRCLDLTNLDDDCDEEAVDALCAAAKTVHGPVAAVCVWPRFVAQARTALAGSKTRVATVVNFPSGGGHELHVLTEVEDALAARAHEIDLVMPFGMFAAGHVARTARMLAEVKRLCAARPMKVILETGALGEPSRIRHASELAIGAGADFLKTSTGKTKVGATPEAVEQMLVAISSAAHPVGLKVSGGVRSLEDAERYIRMAERACGKDYIKPATFRIGASSLLGELLKALAEER